MEQQAKFEGWAIVEMMGHQREIGFVTTEAYGVSVMFRVDTPEIPEIEMILHRPQYGNDGNGGGRYLPVGSKVKREATPARTRLVSPQALYAINPCTEDAAKEAVIASTNRPIVLLELPKPHFSLVASAEDGHDTCAICDRPADEGHSPDCPNGAEALEPE